VPPRPPAQTHFTQAEGFSADIIDRFFRPFLGGIFFDRQLGTSSRLFQFVMRMLATGSNCLPAGGIGAMSEQLAGQLPPDAVHLGEGGSREGGRREEEGEAGLLQPDAIHVGERSLEEGL
jgi:hypothetical protein